MPPRFKVGVYVDGFNLYYGGRSLCPLVNGWKWLDLRSLAKRVVSANSGWPEDADFKVVYATSEVTDSPASLARQQKYILALRAYGSVDNVLYGTFRSAVRESPVALRGSASAAPLQFSADPLPAAHWTHFEAETSHLLVSHRRRDEKGSDVNLATSLVVDALTRQIDAAVLVSNDSDFELPLSTVRQFIPVGVVNPRGNYTAGRLRGSPN